MIPSLKDWKANTSQFGWRSTELIAVDTAIANYETCTAAYKAAGRTAIGEAWKAWKAKHAGANLAGHKRNAHGVLEMLDLEFAAAAQVITLNAVSQFRRTPPEAWPNGVGCDEAVGMARIDKAFLEAQVLLRLATRKLSNADSATTALVARWFGKDATVGVMNEKYAKVLDTLESRLKGAAGHASVKIKVEIGAGANKDAIAAVSAKIDDASGPNMIFYHSFFDDEKVVPASNFSNQFAFKYKSVAEIEAAVKELTSEKNKVAAADNRLTQLIMFLERRKAGVVDATPVQEGLRALVGNASPDFETMAKAMGHMQAFGIPGNLTMAGALAKAREVKGERSVEAAEKLAQRATTTYSASGAILHELTHMILSTNDEMFKGMPCYGAPLCWALAQTNSKTAMNNADSYRIFAESCLL